MLIEREKISMGVAPPPTAPTPTTDLPSAQSFARGFSGRCRQSTNDDGGGGGASVGIGNIGTDDKSTRNEDDSDGDDVPLTTMAGDDFLTPAEEATLVSFYASKLPNLIGPAAQVSRLRRESKVTATAALLLRRFFLSNSVMMFDPKAIMVAAAFLGSKVEDATADIRNLEEGTALMNAPVSQMDIIPAEISLLAGIQFDLLCFHPYKAVVALTEDLRTFLKTEKGQQLCLMGEDGTPVRPDLKSIYDGARHILDEVIISDIPLLYSPGQVGLAALILACEQLPHPPMDLRRYVTYRFPEKGEGVQDVLEELITMMSNLPTEANLDLSELKSIHKKLKKVRIWGNAPSKKKTKAKRDDSATDEQPPKRAKVVE